MELRQLEYFVAVAEERSFSRGAERAHVVQSAVSTAIAKLERELDMQLLDRAGHRITLTPPVPHSSPRPAAPWPQPGARGIRSPSTGSSSAAASTSGS
ncbi:LysR family transcriptional regulator [Streptomyces chiangmaiensis]